MTDGASRSMTNLIIQVTVGVVLVILGFVAIAGSDVTLGGAYWIWVLVVVLYAVVDFAAEARYRADSMEAVRGIPTTIIHWVAVFLAIQMMYYFVAAGRIDNADTGLANGAILALGTFTAGNNRNWRMMVVGVMLAIAATAVSMFEQYMWLLMLLVILAAVIFVYGARYFGQVGPPSDPV